MGNLFIIIALLLITVGIFFIFRSVVNWYFRINEIVETLKSIDKKINEKGE
jgi:hypothetical protein